MQTERERDRMKLQLQRVKKTSECDLDSGGPPLIRLAFRLGEVTARRANGQRWAKAFLQQQH